MQKRSVFYAKFHKQKRPGSGGQFRQLDELRVKLFTPPVVKLFTPPVVKLFTPSVVKLFTPSVVRKFRLLVLVQAEL